MVKNTATERAEFMPVESSMAIYPAIGIVHEHVKQEAAHFNQC